MRYVYDETHNNLKAGTSSDLMIYEVHYEEVPDDPFIAMHYGHCHRSCLGN